MRVCCRRVIGRLTGKIQEEEDGGVLLEVGGVGYELSVPLGTVGRAKSDASGHVTLFVHTHAREDALVLFGFASAVDRSAFRTLIGISNVGPKTAVQILSALPAPELARAVAGKDVQRLTSIPGVGKKTAERLLLELRDKLTALPSALPAGEGEAPPAPVPLSKPGEVLLSALTRMGYRTGEAERAVAGLGERVDREPLEALVREALALLSK
jgi:Holliday junction DNA helicase RuvA